MANNVESDPRKPQPSKYTDFSDQQRREMQRWEEEKSAMREGRVPWHTRILQNHVTPSSNTSSSNTSSATEFVDSAPQKTTFEQKKEEAAARRKTWARLAELNPQMAEEREKRGELGSPNPSLLQIPVVNMNGMHELKRYLLLVDWNDRKSVLGLNSWRYAVIYRCVGAINARQEPLAKGKPFHKQEKLWLHQRTKNLGVHTRNEWDQIHQDFNLKFWKQILPESEEPRPYRTKLELQTLRTRLDIKTGRGRGVVSEGYQRLTGSAGPVSNRHDDYVGEEESEGSDSEEYEDDVEASEGAYEL